MAKQVFRPNEIKVKDAEKKFTLPLLHDYRPQEESPEVVEEVYHGPTADDLRREAEAYKQGWEIEKQHLMDEANAKAAEIIQNAKDAAFNEVKRQTDEAAVIKADAQKEAEKIINEANAQKEQILQEAEKKVSDMKAQAEQNGYQQGYDEGIKSGEQSMNMLISRLHKMVEAVMSRREEILKETE